MLWSRKNGVTPSEKIVKSASFVEILSSSKEYGILITHNGISYDKNDQKNDGVKKLCDHFQMTVIEPYINDSFGEIELCTQSIDDYICQQRAIGYDADTIDKFKIQTMIQLTENIKQYSSAKTICVFIKIMLSYFDMITDWYVTYQFILNNRTIGYIQCGSIILSHILHALAAYNFGQYGSAIMFSLCGFKMSYESYNYITYAKEAPGQLVTNDVTYWITKIIDISFKSVVQILIQTFAYFKYKHDRNYINNASLCLSIISLCIASTFADIDFDKSKYFRKSEPLYYGYISKTYAYRQTCCLLLFFLSYSMFRMLALIMFGLSCSFILLSIYIAIEFLIFAAVRAYLNRWRFYLRIIECDLTNWVVHLGLYVALSFAPFPIIRLPPMLSPIIYMLSLLYMLIVNNILCVIACIYSQEYITSTYMAFILPVLTIGSVVPFLYILYASPAQQRNAFFMVSGFKEYMNTFYFEEKRFVCPNPNPVDREHLRATIPLWCTDCYWPKEKLTKFYRQKWKAWIDSPPIWFTNDFRRGTPTELLSGVERDLWYEKESV